MRQTDRDVAAIIKARQRAALGQDVPIDAGPPDQVHRADRAAYAHNPRPTTVDVPEAFEASNSQAASAPAATTTMTTHPAASAPTTPPTTRRAEVFTLTDALAYAQRHRREYQSAKETLYLAALNLTLERHLWTPIFASELKTVYGNYGEAQDFDQAMRFVADLSVAQRLPYGGEFTASMISTLIRDVKQTITSAEGSDISLGLNVPLLRGAGHVAQESLIQLERELTYSVRVFERFRRQQLVTVAQAYFNLLRSKQRVIDSQTSYENFVRDVERARAFEEIGTGKKHDTQRAEQNMLDAENRLESAREAFRSSADNFKLLIGMPVDEPLGMDDLEDIETIERQIETGVYPLLARPLAVDDEELAVEVALQRRFDLMTLSDRIDDARRGVEISRNALLPDLDWSSSLTFDTDPSHYNMGAFHFDRANWRSELTLSLPLERTAERNDLRRSMIGVRQAQRSKQDQTERIRAEVRGAVNETRLRERSLEIQSRRVQVLEAQREYTQWRYEEGEIDNLAKIEAENAWVDARNQLNLAKTDRWGALLQFRLATETLRVDEDGAQQPDPDVR